MLQLLMVVMGICLLAMTVAGGISYVNFDSFGRAASTQLAATGFRTWEHAYSAYRMAYRAAPANSADLTGFLGGGVPKALEGFAWSYGSDQAGAYICLAGSTSSRRDFAGLEALGSGSQSSSLPPGALQFGGGCGSSGTFALGPPAAVTYRLTQ